MGEKRVKRRKKRAKRAKRNTVFDSHSLRFENGFQHEKRNSNTSIYQRG